MNSLLKILCIIMNNRLNSYCETKNLINKGQIGFRSKHRPTDHILTLRSVINKYDKKIYTCFIDFKKAFDSIWHKGLFYKLKDNNITGNFLQLISTIYKQTKCAIKINQQLTHLFSYKKGIRQSDPLSPTLFNIFVNNSPVNLDDEENISSLMYADDLVIMSTSIEGLQKMLDKLHQYTDKWDLSINYNKTKCVTFSKGNRKEKHNFTMNSQVIDNSITYKYLGITIHKNGSFKPTLDDLSSKATKAIYVMNCKLNIKFLPIKTALKLFTSLISPILLYGCEIWEPFLNYNVDNWDDNPIEKLHTQFLKRLIGVNRSTTNILVRGDLGRKPLQVNALSRNISYLEYLSNKQNNSLAVQAYIYEKGKLGQRITIENSINKLSLQLTTMEIPFVNIINAPTSTIKKYINKIYEE